MTCMEISILAPSLLVAEVGHFNLQIAGKFTA